MKHDELYNFPTELEEEQITRRTDNSLICLKCNKLILEELKGTEYYAKFTCPRCHTVNTAIPSQPEPIVKISEI